MEITELKAKRDSALATTEKRLTTYKKMVLGEVPWQLRRLRIQCYHCCDSGSVPAQELLHATRTAKNKKQQQQQQNH